MADEKDKPFENDAFEILKRVMPKNKPTKPIPKDKKPTDEQ